MGNNTLRCSCCNRTTNINVCNSYEDLLMGYSGRNFYSDPNNPLDILCFECKDIIDKTLSEFGDDDESG